MVEDWLLLCLAVAAVFVLLIRMLWRAGRRTADPSDSIRGGRRYSKPRSLPQRRW
jgi:hypothetical protein